MGEEMVGRKCRVFAGGEICADDEMVRVKRYERSVERGMTEGEEVIRRFEPVVMNGTEMDGEMEEMGYERADLVGFEAWRYLEVQSGVGRNGMSVGLVAG